MVEQWSPVEVRLETTSVKKEDDNIDTIKMNDMTSNVVFEDDVRCVPTDVLAPHVKDNAN
jgi:hypothetical protein